MSNQALEDNKQINVGVKRYTSHYIYIYLFTHDMDSGRGQCTYQAEYFGDLEEAMF